MAEGAWMEPMVEVVVTEETEVMRVKEELDELFVATEFVLDRSDRESIRGLAVTELLREREAVIGGAGAGRGLSAGDGGMADFERREWTRCWSCESKED